MKIDCKITENYIREKNRMLDLDDDGNCSYITCSECAFNKAGACVSNMEVIDIQKAIEIVQKWSDEHQEKTILDYLLEMFPDTPLDENGTPIEICPSSIGFPTEICKNYAPAEKCIKCWSRLYEEN